MPEGPGVLDVARLGSIVMNNSFTTAAGLPGDAVVTRNRWDTQTGTLRYHSLVTREKSHGGPTLQVHTVGCRWLVRWLQVDVSSSLPLTCGALPTGDYLDPVLVSRAYSTFESQSVANNLVGMGLWGLLPSLFNHSCAYNTGQCKVGNFIFFRTLRDIEAGEELCITYGPGSDSYAARTARLAAWNKVSH